MGKPSPNGDNTDPRQTEPMPSDWRPALRFLGFLMLVTALIAGAAAVVDRIELCIYRTQPRG